MVPDNTGSQTESKSNIEVVEDAEYTIIDVAKAMQECDDPSKVSQHYWTTTGTPKYDRKGNEVVTHERTTPSLGYSSDIPTRVPIVVIQTHVDNYALLDIERIPAPMLHAAEALPDR